jgi:ribonuclease HI
MTRYTGAFDGGATPNPGDMKIGGFIKLHGKTIFRYSDSIGYGTNNIAEYASLLKLVKQAQRLGIQNIYIQGDSQLVINQVNGEWKARDPRMKQYRDRVIATLKHIKKWEIKHVVRKHNQEADSLT